MGPPNKERVRKTVDIVTVAMKPLKCTTHGANYAYIIVVFDVADACTKLSSY